MRIDTFSHTIYTVPSLTLLHMIIKNNTYNYCRDYRCWSVDILINDVAMVRVIAGGAVAAIFFMNYAGPVVI